MCALLLDSEIETGTQSFTNDDPIVLTCAEGRVIIAATAWVGNASTATPIAVSLSDGTPTNTCTVYPSSNVVGSLTKTVRYSLTTVRVATI